VERTLSARMTTEESNGRNLYPHAFILIVSVLITQMSRLVLGLPACFTRLKASVWFPGFALPSLHGTQLTTCPCQDMPKPKVRSTRTKKANRLFRYTRLIVNCISHWTFRPIPIPETPTYTSDDVTIILPTIATGGEELETTLRTCLRANVHELILETVDSNAESLSKVANAVNAKKIRVLSIREANKRRQMCRAISEVSTRITVFVDDDVAWPSKALQWMLAPFEDPKMGGVGTSQRLKRSADMSIWSFLGAAYLERRNFDCSACLHIDGGLPCLSGRTVAYRSSILQDEAFIFGFTNEEWRTCQLNADDDNFITRWKIAMQYHNWKIAMQYHKEADDDNFITRWKIAMQYHNWKIAMQYHKEADDDNFITRWKIAMQYHNWKIAMQYHNW